MGCFGKEGILLLTLIECGVQIGTVRIYDSVQWFSAEFGILSLRHTPLSLFHSIA